MKTNDLNGTRQVKRVELGGGGRPRGEGFVNLDLCETADIRCNLESDKWPLEDDSVQEMYSSHFLEHVANTGHVLHEIARVCSIGARVEIRVPYWNQSMALCQAHKKTISLTQVKHWCQDFISDWWPKEICKKRLKLLRVEYIPGNNFAEAKELLGWFTDEQIMRLIPDACHENRFYFEAIANG